jgi:hypothetical protein
MATMFFLTILDNNCLITIRALLDDSLLQKCEQSRIRNGAVNNSFILGY